VLNNYNKTLSATVIVALACYNMYMLNNKGNSMRNVQLEDVVKHFKTNSTVTIWLEDDWGDVWDETYTQDVILREDYNSVYDIVGYDMFDGDDFVHNSSGNIAFWTQADAQAYSENEGMARKRK